MKQQRYHVSEFGALASVQIELCLARKEKEAARSWYEMLQGIDPDSVYLEVYYDRLYGRKVLPVAAALDRSSRHAVTPHAPRASAKLLDASSGCSF